MKFTEGCKQRWDILQAQGWAHQIFGCFECRASHALQANSCLSHESFQTISAVRLHLKCACLNQGECSRRKALIVWVTKRKRHICRKAPIKSCLGVQHDKHSVQQDTQQRWLAHQHPGRADLFLQGQNNCIFSCKQALLNCSKHTLTPETADAPNLAGFACCDPHTRFVRPGQEGQALKYPSLTLSSENNCKKLQRAWSNGKD